jgi:hypothetical protein
MVDLKRMLERLLEKYEKDYEEEKRKECEDLYNALVQVIAEKRATVQNVLFVLRMIEFELLNEKHKQLVEGGSK